jgi:predicted dehydrogenase
MDLDIAGRPTSARHIRAGFIGCGSHAFRNVYPTFQFAPVNLIATCDLDADKAASFARQFGAERSYTDHRKMIESEKLDAVFIVTNYDENGRPRYVKLATDCVRAGLDVWMEKPPAASSAELEELRAIAGERRVMVGFKKMFFPANEKARELITAADFGRPMLAQLQYPQSIPTTDDLRRYIHEKQGVNSVLWFLDHLCHPVSLLLFLMGMPKTLYYERTANGAGVAMFGYADDRVATIALTHGSASATGMERTTIISDKGRHVIVDNNIRVSYHRDTPGREYGKTPNYYVGTPDQTTASWEPEFSLGQLYNKGIFLLGYYGEVNEFAQAIVEGRPVSKAHLEHACQATRIFEAFAQGPRKVIEI